MGIEDLRLSLVLLMLFVRRHWGWERVEGVTLTLY
jgi:hypothetical protein